MTNLCLRARFSKDPINYRDQKVIAKSRTLPLQSCFVPIFLILTEVSFIQEIWGVFRYSWTKNGFKGPKSFRGFFEKRTDHVNAISMKGNQGIHQLGESGICCHYKPELACTTLNPKSFLLWRRYIGRQKQWNTDVRITDTTKQSCYSLVGIPTYNLVNGST